MTNLLLLLMFAASDSFDLTADLDTVNKAEWVVIYPGEGGSWIPDSSTLDRSSGLFGGMRYFDPCVERGHVWKTWSKPPDRYEQELVDLDSVSVLIVRHGRCYEDFRECLRCGLLQQATRDQTRVDIIEIWRKVK